MCDSAGVQVVLSSAWRITHTHKEAADALGLPIIDATPNLGTKRGEEIAAWLERHPEVTDYAIVDDDGDMLPGQMHRFVQTSGHEGMTWGDFSRLCGLFCASPYEGEPRDRNWRQKLAWEM
jgi:hypothetical protein